MLIVVAILVDGTIAEVAVTLVLVVVVVVVESHPLHVLSHSPGTMLHKSRDKIVKHCSNGTLFCLCAHRCAVTSGCLLVVAIAVPIVVVESHPLQVLSH